MRLCTHFHFTAGVAKSNVLTGARLCEAHCGALMSPQAGVVDDCSD
jgi:hypothetical protein